MRLLLLAVLAAAARGQSPLPYADRPPSASETPPSISTAPPTASEPPPAAPRLKRPLRAVIHRQAADWEPLSLRAGGEPERAATSVTLRLVKRRGRLKGETSRAKAFARVYKGARDSRWLVISLFPKTLEARRTHLEVRFRIFEGFVEAAAAAAVTVGGGRPIEAARSARFLDSFGLRSEGVEFQEERPGSGALIVSALDPRPRADAVNAGRLEKAEFADKTFGFVSLSWSVRGVSAK